MPLEQKALRAFDSTISLTVTHGRKTRLLLSPIVLQGPRAPFRSPLPGLVEVPPSLRTCPHTTLQRAHGLWLFQFRFRFTHQSSESDNKCKAVSHWHTMVCSGGTCTPTGTWTLVVSVSVHSVKFTQQSSEGGMHTTINLWRALGEIRGPGGRSQELGLVLKPQSVHRNRCR